MATIQTSLGTVTTDLDNILLKVTGIEGDLVTMSSALGDLNGTLLSIQGDIAVIKTDIGNILVSLGSLMPKPAETPLWFALAGILIGVPVTGGAIFYFRRRSKGGMPGTLASQPNPVVKSVQPEAPQKAKRRGRKPKGAVVDSDALKHL